MIDDIRRILTKLVVDQLLSPNPNTSTVASSASGAPRKEQREYVLVYLDSHNDIIDRTRIQIMLIQMIR